MSGETIFEKYRVGFIAAAVALIMVGTHISGMPLSYDFGGHLSRIYILLHSGMGWTDMWYNGHVLFGFYPPLYHLMMAPVATVSFELVRPISFALVGVTAFYSMYYYARRKLDENRAVAAGLLFITGYLLYIAHISGSMPQAFAIALTPMFYAEIEGCLEGKTPALPAVLGAAILLFHHNAAVAVALGAATIILLNWDKNVLNAASAGVLTALIASFWLLPALTAYSDTSYVLLNDIALRGIESIVLVLPVFTAAIGLKLAASLDSLRQHRQETALLALGLILSTGFVTPITGHIPVIYYMPPYRFYAVSAFATSFLAAAARKEVLTVVLAASLILSGLALQYNDDAGFRPGQRQAYEHIEDTDVDLVYDSENTDIRAYAITIHGKDVADGWSIGSTPLRPGLNKLERLQNKGSSDAAGFLRRWGVDTAITYQDRAENRMLHEVLNESEDYRLDRCFEETCIFRLQNPVNAVIRHEGNVYTVNASRPLPIPYSSRFNGSVSKTEEGFLEVEEGGVQTVEYRPGVVPGASAVISLLALAAAGLIYRRGIVVPEAYSKSFRHKLGLCAE